ncbi:MAG: hypothetical protein ACI849_001737, partial [Patiriisocius sp.]|jgi:hypothetical protein
MNTHADKTKENKSQTVTAKTSQMQSGVESTFQFLDNRPESIQMQQLQELANNSAQISGIAQLQAIADNFTTQEPPIQRQENKTGLPDNLKIGTENLSGLPRDDVKVQRNSDKPAQFKSIKSGDDDIEVSSMPARFTQLQKKPEVTQLVGGNEHGFEEIEMTDMSNVGLNHRALQDPANYVKNYAKNNWFEVLRQYKAGELHHSDRKDSEPHGMQELLNYRETLTKQLLKEAITPVREHEMETRKKQYISTMNEQEPGKNHEADAETFAGETKNLAGNVPGSDNPTSDIDVNMSGDGTEYGAFWLNQEFITRYGSGQESGVVYDVNFYAQDFVPGKVFGLKDNGKLNKTKGTGTESDNPYFDEDEDWRTHVVKDEGAIATDKWEQDVSSTLMMRVNMDEEDWAMYKHVAPDNRADVIAAAEKRFIDRGLKINKVKEDINEVETDLPGTENRDDELSNMGAENETYERVLLEKVEPARIAFQILKRQLNAAEKNGMENDQKSALQKQVDLAYVQLKTEKTKAMTYANAAYYSQGAVAGVVTNKQQLGRMYKPKKEEDKSNTKSKENYKNLKLTAAEYYNGFTEQIGFAFHGLHKAHGDEFYMELGLLGKYVHRTYNLMKHLYKVSESPFPFAEEERRAASDWEGIKQGKSLNEDASGYSKAIPQNTANDQLEKIIETFLGEKLDKPSGELNKPAAILKIKIMLIATKATIDAFYPTVTGDFASVKQENTKVQPV